MIHIYINDNAFLQKLALLDLVGTQMLAKLSEKQDAIYSFCG